MSSIWDWSLTPGENATADADINWAEGQLAKTVNNSARQMMARLVASLMDQSGMVLSNGTNAVSVVLNAPPASYFSGFSFVFKAANTSTSSTVTMNVNGIGQKSLRKIRRTGTLSSPLDPGDIQVGGFYRVTYNPAADGGDGAFILFNPALTDMATKGTINNDDWSGAVLTIANGGTGAAGAATARENLGLKIGTDILAYTGDLNAISAPSGSRSSNKFIVLTGTNAAAWRDITTFAQNFLSNAAGTQSARNALGFGDVVTRDMSSFGQLATSNFTDLVYGGTVGSANNFPIGTTLAVYNPNSILARNEALTPRLDPDQGRQWRTGGAGDTLAGNWRARGATDNSGSYYNMQRVS